MTYWGPAAGVRKSPSASSLMQIIDESLCPRYSQVMQKWHVFEMMTRDCYRVHPNTPLKEATRFLIERRATAAPVINDTGELIGLVSLVDVAADGLVEHETTRFVHHVMQHRVYTIDQAATLTSAAEELKRRRVHRLVVVEHDRVVGVLSCLDLLDVVLESAGYSPPVL